jgi:hypothetical protein
MMRNDSAEQSFYLSFFSHRGKNPTVQHGKSVGFFDPMENFSARRFSVRAFEKLRVSISSPSASLAIRPECKHQYLAHDFLPSPL